MGWRDRCTLTWQAWCSMRQRCYYLKSPSYKNYGGRGIVVCEHWRYDKAKGTGYERFLADMGVKPVGKSLERKNNDLGYLCPLCLPPDGNCKWATLKEQRANQRPRPRKHRPVTSEGEVYSRTLRAFLAKQSPEYLRERTRKASASGLAKIKAISAQKDTFCLHCGHGWHKRTQGRPPQCPACRTPNWDIPVAAALPSLAL
jgi:hypothetical protein